MSELREKPRALVVEDDRSWQQILEEILSDMGLEVDKADCIESAVTELQMQPHRLAVIDLSLGKYDHTNQDGLCVLDEVRLHDPNCIAILLTGYATVEIAVSSLTEHGAFTCLRKSNFRRSEFHELVRQALAQAPLLETTRLHDTETTVPQANAPDGRQADSEIAENLVLVVDDDASWRNILSELLTEAGYQIQLCSSFGEALGHLRRRAYDLAVVDLALSSTGKHSIDQEGYRLLDNARQSGIPTLVVSGTASPDEIERAYKEHGAFACLEKQAFDRRTFLQTVAEARDSHLKSSELNVLTDREREVLALLTRGMTNKDIADVLFITNNTVKRHLKAIFEKLSVHTRAAAVAKAINAGFPTTSAE